MKLETSVTTARFDARIKGVLTGAAPAVERALFAGMQLVFRQSQREVPVLLGALKNSGQLKEPERVGLERVRVAITYGGAASAYAEIQHENRTLNHPRGGKAGFVIDPLRQAVPDIENRIQAALKTLGAQS